VTELCSNITPIFLTLAVRVQVMMQDPVIAADGHTYEECNDDMAAASAYITSHWPAAQAHTPHFQSCCEVHHWRMIGH